MILKIPIVHPVSEKFTGAPTYSLFNMDTRTGITDRRSQCKNNFCVGSSGKGLRNGREGKE